MSKIFISDLHLGDGSKADDFHRDKEFIKLVQKYDEDNLYLLGDIFELWQCDLDKIMWNHKDVCDIIFGYYEEFQNIYGNHDYLPFSKYWNETYEDELIFAQHGHQHDIYNKAPNPIGKPITRIVGWLERLIHPNADDYLLAMEKKYGEFITQAMKLKSAEKNEDINFSGKFITIEGHTHKAELFRDDNTDRIYANTGTWVDGVEPTYIQINDDSVQLRNGINYEIIKEIKL